MNIYQVVLETFQCGSKLLSIYISNHWEDLRWSYRPKWLRKIARKTGNLKMWISTKPCYKLFSVVQNYFLCIFQIIERIWWWSYAQNNLENLRKTGNLKMRISTKSCYKLFSVVQNYFLYIFQIIERIYDDPIPQNNLEKLRKTGNLEMWISTKSCYKLFSVVQNYFLCIFQITWEDIWWSYRPK